jgi:error-prone DNA polymerase
MPVPSTTRHGWHPETADIRAERSAVGSVEVIALQLVGWTPPLLAIRTHHSPLEGSRSPQSWAKALDTLGVSCALLADRDDLAGLPAAQQHWGRERVAVGATVRWRETDVILYAPTQEGYRALCRLLTWKHHQPTAWADGRLPAGMDGLLALVRTVDAVEAFRACGAEVWWRSGAEPDDGPGGCPAAAVAELAHIAATDRGGDQLLAALRRREGRDHGTGGALEDLVAMRQAYAGREDLLRSGAALAARCAYRPGGGWHMPPSLHADALGELTRRATQGALARYGDPLRDEVRIRLARELAVIEAKDFCGYILTVADLVGGRRTCGRGSGASSLVNYCLGITNVDPIRWNLLFERFLAPSRADPPDLDVDFPWDERDAVLAAAIHTYGAGHVAAVANHLHLKKWSALRTVARAAGQSDVAISAVRDRLRAESRYGIPARLDGPWPGILAAAERVVDAPHHLGLHCGGIVITREAINDLAPTHPAAKQIDGSGLPTLPWEKDGTEAMGLVKIDLLGNRSLAVIRDSLEDLRAMGIAIDEVRWRPADDPLTCAIVARGDTLGCFYIESPAMRQLQAKAGSGDFDRLVVHSSIIRPAASRWIDTYLTRLHEHRRTGRIDESWFPHPVLRRLLSDSYGILSYQEDVMMAATGLAGFDDVQANRLRKALGHFGAGSEIARFAEAFRTGCAAKGVAAEVCETVWDMISSFSGYSFCKAHSASYAMVSFQCAWLKAHHPAVFLARVIANEGGFYTPAAYIEEARRRGVAIRGPSVLASTWKTAPEGGGAIRCGLHLVPHLGRTAADRIARERARAPFAGIADLRQRCGLDATRLESLLHTGALDGLTPLLSPAQRAWVVAALVARPVVRLREALPDEQWIDLAMARLPDADPDAPALPELDPRPARLHSLGFLPECHRLSLHRSIGRRIPAAGLSPAMRNRSVVVVGIPITSKQVDAQSRDPAGGTQTQAMSFVTLEDESGLIETVWFPDAYRAYGALLDTGAPLRVEGRLLESFGVLTLQAERVAPA